ncbi:hypothetical protein KD666_003778 [Salmonella enterica subsp. enterica serovar Carrau]|nr:hypothetical protein [Salmonella enterica subsp. enterica serovar Carrau]
MTLNIKKIAIYAICFIILAFFYASISRQILPSSDAVSGLLEGKDIADGNWTLSGWYLSTVSFYFTDIIWYGLASKIFWYGQYQAYCIPAIMYSMVTLMTFYLSKERLSSVWAISFCVALPSGFAALNILIPVIHVGTYVAMLFCFIMLDNYSKTKSLISISLYILVLALACFSDDIIKLLIIAPVAISSVIFMVKDKSPKNLIIFVATIFAYVASKFMVMYTSTHNWYILPGVPDPTFVAFDDILKNFYFFIKGFLLYSGAFFFGKPPSDITAIISVFCFVVMISLLIIFAMSVKEIFKISMINMAICIACLIMIPAYLASNRPIDEWTIRYIVPFFILAPVVIGRSNTSKGWKFIVFGLVTTSVLLCSIYIQEKKDTSNDIINQIKNTVRQNNLTNGYASFWFASSASIDRDISIAPIDVNRGLNILACNKWLSKNYWYERGGNFVITDDDVMRNITIKEVGKPSKIIDVGDKKIFVYDKNITFSCN